jgi:hypothetical protein
MSERKPKILIFDSDTGAYISVEKFIVKQESQKFKDPDKEAITLNDIYRLLLVIIELLSAE